ncbi:MAG TPA: AMP-binding protein, partial [Acidobacteriota bacterium]|nr:AMP-binding protein [Acidobacteriota bacterium]
ECYAKRHLGYTETDRTISVPKLFFGYATGSNLMFPFSVGGASILFPERCTAEAVFQMIRKHRPTILINVPTMVNHMVSHPGAASQDLSSLRFATSAGEALPVELYERWKKLFGVELLDGLGTAEMWHIFISNRLSAVKAGTVGQAVAGFEVKAADEEGREVPVGEIGMCWVRGRSRAIGYWQLMEKTASAFRGEWYVTGDLIRRDADGYYTHCGRADDMMKVSGKWLSPLEVENCLLKHPSVRECAVVPLVDAGGLTKPCAYVVARETRAGLDEELKEFVKSHLEPYKYPRQVVFVDTLPRTHLGKVDRAALKRISHR